MTPDPLMDKIVPALFVLICVLMILTIGAQVESCL